METFAIPEDNRGLETVFIRAIKRKYRFVGAGPGGRADYRSRDRLREADVVIYDRLVHPLLGRGVALAAAAAVDSPEVDRYNPRWKQE